MGGKLWIWGSLNLLKKLNMLLGICLYRQGPHLPTGHPKASSIESLVGLGMIVPFAVRGINEKADGHWEADCGVVGGWVGLFLRTM